MNLPHTDVSVITVVLNGAQNIQQTIDSVHSQIGVKSEHLVVDGGSSDDTVEILKCNENKLAWWVSEPDHGISDAMNKGLAHAQGEWVLFLGADDFLVNINSLAGPCAAAASSPGVDILACNVKIKTESGGEYIWCPRSLNSWTRYKIPMNHQGVMFRRRTLIALGGFDTSYAICMDYNLLLRAYLRGVKALCLPLTLSVMRDNGISSRRNWSSLAARFAEERRIHRANSGFPAWLWRYGWYWPSYLSYRWLRYHLWKR